VRDIVPKLTSSSFQIIKAWETSGNGFGQLVPRTEDDENFGHYDPSRMTDGDNRKSFIKKSSGHRLHHLYFWVLADECGMLKNVLNVLSADVSGDADRVPGDTALTKKARLGVRSSPTEDIREVKKQKYRDGVQDALASIGQGMNEFNKMKDYSIGLHRLSVTNDAIAQVRNCIRAEEASIQKFKLGLILATTAGEKELYEGLLSHHLQRVEDFVNEELGLCDKRNKVAVDDKEREDAANGRFRRGNI
jgi:hypothetical protein